MPLGSVASLLALAGLAFAESRSHADREWRWLAVVALVYLAVTVVFRGGVVTEPLFGQGVVFDLAAASWAVLMAVDLIGLPLHLARRLHLGLRSREWEFHRRLFALTEKARRVVESPSANVDNGKRELLEIAARMRALKAPNEDWADLRDHWASMWEWYVADRDEDVEPRTREEYLASNAALIERTTVLSARYRADAARILGRDS